MGHIDERSVVQTLIDKNKLVNQIARLVAIAVKINSIKLHLFFLKGKYCPGSH